MKTCIEKLRKHIAEHPPNFKTDSIVPLLDTIYWHYTEFNRLDNDEINDKFDAIYTCLNHLSIRNTDMVMNTVYSLCIECERVSFHAGIQLGFFLAQELATG